MGGPGSGRYDYATTPTVGECRMMDMDDMKEVTEHPNTAGELYWGEPEADDRNWLKWRTEGLRKIGGEERAKMIRLVYTTTHYPSEESSQVNYTVPIDYTEPNYGGVRPWFVCPECDTRRRKLYLPPRRGASRYLCRECYDLGYHTSRTSGDDVKQAELRYRRTFAKADAEGRRPHPNNASHFPDKPKGMHWDTFDSLVEDARDAREEWHTEMDRKMRELLERYQPPRSPL